MSKILKKVLAIPSVFHGGSMICRTYRKYLFSSMNVDPDANLIIRKQ